MAKKLYVGNLPYSMRDDELQSMFAEFGGVSSAVVITDKMSGRSKGFGFVEFDSDPSADQAMSAMNGKEISGRAIVVNEARPMTDRKPGGGGGFQKRDRGGYGGGGGGGGGGRRGF